VCTIALIHRVRTDCSLIVAANRDEFYARPATGPQVLDRGRSVVVGGRDHKGGTWMGVTRSGLFVGLTNQRTGEEPPPGARSRGEIVLEALRAGSVAGVHAVIEGADVREFPPFNLAFGDGEQLWVAYARATGWELVELAPGVHVLANDRLGSPWFPKADRLRKRIEERVAQPYPSLREHLEHALGDTEVPEDVPVDSTSPVPIEWARALQALCIRTEVYGTRSATIAALSPGHVRDYRFADGPPDEHPFRDYTALVTDG
jgi:uncharacterized protein with NRDE domain